MSFVHGSITRVFLNGHDLTPTCEEVTVYWDPDTKWNLVVDGYFDTSSETPTAKLPAPHTMLWARQLKKYTKLGWEPTPEDRYEGSGNVKNFKVVSTPDSVVEYRLHVTDIQWSS